MPNRQHRLMKKGDKSKDGAHVWDQTTLRALHQKGNSDVAIAELFGCPPALVTFGRKRDSFWDAVEEVASTVDESVEKPSESIESKKKKEPKS